VYGSRSRPGIEGALYCPVSGWYDSGAYAPFPIPRRHCGGQARCGLRRGCPCLAGPPMSELTYKSFIRQS